MEMIYGNVNLHNVNLTISAGLTGQLIKSGVPQIAFSGRSNVGKSSLVNSLLGRKKLARVSGEPGKTITVNYYDIDKKMFFVDLPGYGFARRPKADKDKWSRLTQGYFVDNQSITLVLQLIDCRIGPTEDDEMMLEWLSYYNVPYIIVLTKSDKLNKTALQKSAEAIVRHPSVKEGTECVLYSSLKGLGRDTLLNIIFEKVNENVTR